MGSCQILQSWLSAPGAYSPTDTGYFNGDAISGGASIGEQVAAYATGTGPAALAAAGTTFEKCGFSPIPGLPSNIIKFTGSVSGNECEWEIARRGDVLIEVGIDQSGQDAIVSNLVSAITVNVNKEL